MPPRSDRPTSAEKSPRRPVRGEDREWNENDTRRHELRKKPGLASRGAALDLMRLVRKGRSLEDALAICRSFEALEGPDRGFARHLATTCLRRQGSLDAVVDHYLNSPLKADQHELRALLRLAAAQITLMDTPPHAAASTAVDLARERGDTMGFAKLVNAISRRMTETGKDTLAKLGAREDTPGWLWRRWERTYGPKTTRALAEAHRIEPPLDMSFKPGSDMAHWAEELSATQVGPLTLRYTEGGRIEELAGYEEGQWWVQDLAASLPASLAGDVTGKSVYDLCAAPGGKSLQLIAGGATVTAVDISGTRVARLNENLGRTNLAATVVVTDVLEWAPEEQADIVLLDAPCTATGTIRRNPDLLWSKREKEVELLTTLQDRMIDQALTLVKPGGLLIFATCSLLPEEGELRVASALDRHPTLTREPVTEAETHGLDVINKQGDLRCLPSMLKDKGGMDGFFASRLRVAG